jgi:hypothetical protein
MKRVKTVYRGSYPLGIIETSRLLPPTPYPYHVTINTVQGPQYLGVCATIAEAKRAIRDNT